jgi:hypothetical protein
MSQNTQPADLQAIHDRLDSGDERMARIESALLANTEATARVETNTSDMVEAFGNLKGAFKVFNWIGRAAKPLGYIAGAIAAIISLWTAFKAGTTLK